MDTNICFIGTGNMARSLIGGLIRDGTDPACISAADPDAQTGAELHAQWPRLTFTSNNLTAASDAAVVVLAVKPQILQTVARELSALDTQPLFISVAAGIRVGDINRWLGNNCAIIRCMPNTPALVQCGAAALYSNTATSQQQKDLAEKLFCTVGMACWVYDESQLDVVTALSGSGPAYFFYLMEAMQTAAENMGLDSETAHQLTLATALGSVQLARESNTGIGTLRQRVTSPKGTTEQAINVFNTQQLDHIIAQAMQSAAQRARELADQLGQKPI